MQYVFVLSDGITVLFSCLSILGSNLFNLRTLRVPLVLLKVRPLLLLREVMPVLLLLLLLVRLLLPLVEPGVERPPLRM